MPLSKVTFTPEQMATERRLLVAARDAGAIESRRLLEFPVGTSTEMVCIDKRKGTLVNPHTFEPISPELWVISCQQRGIIPIVPNI